MTRCLIVNADDFGLTNGVTRGIIEAHERGIVTSASMMVRSATVEAAAEYARMHPEFSVGLHFDAAEWQYREGRWQATYEVIDLHDPVQIREEFERQLKSFERLLGRSPTHLDSHQHVHLSEPARSILLAYSVHLRVPLRACNSDVNYCGDFYGQTNEGEPLADGISLSRFERTVSALSAGWTEMGCHPGHADGIASVYASEREEELRVLCTGGAREALKKHQIDLVSFHDYAHSRST